MKLNQLIYVSHLVNEDESMIAAILESAVRRNKQNAITGMLLYAPGEFIQVLEGDEAAVQETYDRIFLDRRHSYVTCLLHEAISERHFPQWSMGYKALRQDHIEKLTWFAPLFRFRPSDAFKGIRPGDALDMLLLFNRY